MRITCRCSGKARRMAPRLDALAPITHAVGDQIDVLFDSGSYTLKPAARERLARISGIVLAYPDLKLEIEGHTDSVGSDSYNQTLSEKRAASVRDYLVNNGVSINNVIARGFGKTRPVADNSTAKGRQLNRRVEMIVSGDVIGTQVTPGATTTPAPPPQ